MVDRICTKEIPYYMIIKEHEEIMSDMNTFISNFGLSDKFTIKYINDEFQAFEIHLLGWSLGDGEQEYLLEYINNKFNHIIKEIYTIEKGYLYVIYLNPIEEIRVNKISKLQNKIKNETDNKVQWWSRCDTLS